VVLFMQAVLLALIVCSLAGGIPMALYYTSVPIAVSISLTLFLLPSIVYKFSIAINVGEYTQLHFIREVKEKLLRRHQRHHRHRKHLHLHLPHESDSVSHSHLVSPSSSSRVHSPLHTPGASRTVSPNPSPLVTPSGSPRRARRAAATSGPLAAVGTSSSQSQPRLHSHRLRHHYRHHRLHQHTPMSSQANTPHGSRAPSPVASRDSSPRRLRAYSPGLEFPQPTLSRSNSLYGEGDAGLEALTMRVHHPTPLVAAAASRLLNKSAEFGTPHDSASLLPGRSRGDRSTSRQRLTTTSPARPLASSPTTTTITSSSSTGQRHIHHHKYRHAY
jgi:hypothetical protein